MTTPGRESRRRTAVRVAAWRVTGVLLGVVLTWGFTGDWRLGVEIGLTYNIIRLGGHYVHDRFWQRHVTWGLETPRVADGEGADGQRNAPATWAPWGPSDLHLEDLEAEDFPAGLLRCGHCHAVAGTRSATWAAGGTQGIVQWAETHQATCGRSPTALALQLDQVLHWLYSRGVLLREYAKAHPGAWGFHSGLGTILDHAFPYEVTPEGYAVPITTPCPQCARGHEEHRYARAALKPGEERHCANSPACLQAPCKCQCQECTWWRPGHKD